MNLYKNITNETLIGDELRSQQILMNLLSNAGKFTPRGGKIDLKIIETSKSQDRIHIRYIVKDSGCGMSDDMKSRIFNPFEQQSASTAKKHGGSGLGLSITKNLVDLMGGSIQVKSVEGNGCEFIVDIPYTRVENSDNNQNQYFSNIRILVMKSNNESDAYMCSLLNRLKVPHDFATTEDEAFERIADAEDHGNPYKLCLFDWNIRHINVTRFTHMLRDIFGKDGIIIMVLSYDLYDIELQCNNKLIDYFVNKPLFQSALVDVLMSIVGDAPCVSSTAVQDYDFTGKKILLAEDVELNMEVAIKLLNLVNLEVIPAENGQIAVELYESSPVGTYDCILMDVNMPIMNGYEATKCIRSLGKQDSKTIPIYAMTANAFSEDIKSALDCGMDGHIAKPIETKILYQTLKQVLFGGKNE